MHMLRANKLTTQVFPHNKTMLKHRLVYAAIYKHITKFGFCSSVLIGWVSASRFIFSVTENIAEFFIVFSRLANYLRVAGEAILGKLSFIHRNNIYTIGGYVKAII